jgi:hypothetical protein
MLCKRKVIKRTVNCNGTLSLYDLESLLHKSLFHEFTFKSGKIFCGEHVRSGTSSFSSEILLEVGEQVINLSRETQKCSRCREGREEGACTFTYYTTLQCGLTRKVFAGETQVQYLLWPCERAIVG